MSGVVVIDHFDPSVFDNKRYCKQIWNKSPMVMKDNLKKNLCYHGRLIVVNFRIKEFANTLNFNVK